MFEILSLIALMAVFASIKMIIDERKRRNEANEKWKRFQDKHPKKEE
tara:strand:+ start:855 stop:995 length:141 start_codon:yes stop_codon:yes gene_type:complete